MKSFFLRFETFFRMLTLRNWGAPFHYIIVNMATMLVIAVFDMRTMYHPAMPFYTALLIVGIMIYEFWQRTKGQTWQGMFDDMAFNAAGYIFAVIPLIQHSPDVSTLSLVGMSLAALPFVFGKKIKVCIDAGHGGKDHGAVYEGVAEKDVTLRAALILREYLKALGIDTVMVREEDRDIDLGRRIHIPNSELADLFISLHANASPSSFPFGIQSYYYSEVTRKRIGGVIQEALEKVYSRESSWNKAEYGNFYVLRHTAMPAVLIEMGFLSNAHDRGRLTNDYYVPALMEALARAINELQGVDDGASGNDQGPDAPAKGNAGRDKRGKRGNRKTQG